jgi:hypothetical protein
MAKPIEKKAEIIIKESSTISAKVMAIKIKDEKTMAEATDILSKINKQGDHIKAEKEKITKPLNQALKVEQKRWKPAEDAIKKAVAYIKSEMSTYQTNKLAEADEGRNKIVGRMGTGRGKFSAETAGKKMAEITGPEKNVVAESGSVSFKDDYEITVTDVHLIPEEYLEVKIGSMKTAIKAGVVIPGIEYKVIKVPVNRRN